MSHNCLLYESFGAPDLSLQPQANIQTLVSWGPLKHPLRAHLYCCLNGFFLLFFIELFTIKPGIRSINIIITYLGVCGLEDGLRGTNQVIAMKLLCDGRLVRASGSSGFPKFSQFNFLKFNMMIIQCYKQFHGIKKFVMQFSVLRLSSFCWFWIPYPDKDSNYFQDFGHNYLSDSTSFFESVASFVPGVVMYLVQDSLWDLLLKHQASICPAQQHPFHAFHLVWLLAYINCL